MGHKIHPTGIRLGITQEHRSKWYAPSKTYPLLLQEDDRIRTFIKKKYGAAGISDVLIARKADQLEVELKTARPGVIVGRQGSGIEELRSGIQKTIGDRNRQVRINVVEVEKVDADAYLLAEYIAQQLEKRVAFRRTIRMDRGVIKNFLNICESLLGSDRELQVDITSGYRTKKTNEILRQNSSRVAKNSMHLIGRALDFKVRNRSIQNLEGVAKKLTPGGLGVYSGFIHIDTGPYRRWRA